MNTTAGNVHRRYDQKLTIANKGDFTMGNIICGFVFIVIGLLISGGGLYELQTKITEGRKLTEAIYSQLGYKYSTDPNSAHVLYADDSWLTELRKLTLGDKAVYFRNDKSLWEKFADMEERQRSSEQDILILKEKKK